MIGGCGIILVPGRGYCTFSLANYKNYLLYAFMLRMRLINEAHSLTADSDSGIGVFGQFWAANAHGVLIKINAGDTRTDCIDV